ncbi:prophage protein [Escherichia coli]|uniref:hypothetical protein n=1 Tax=Escherichia coli TaxID=562 RepID=UPI0019963236|nr:hypothetical protein [Escherichia coli]CAD5625066.1 prophage protein [Escherichia coli]CAD5876229.1 prophage protein [Escherichia coli]CAD6100229.1 prophage protein [Escherichia coli]
MAELTKEWLQNMITGIESVIDDKSFVCDEIVFKIGEVKNILTAFKVTQASLAAESAVKLHEYKPVGYQRLVDELTMLVKQLTWQLRKVKPDCKLPDKAMDYLKRNELISAEDVLR